MTQITPPLTTSGRGCFYVVINEANPDPTLLFVPFCRYGVIFSGFFISAFY
jgi:hypothetical protein